jgi:hypothetical protein
MTWLLGRQAAALAAVVAGLLWIVVALLYAFGPVSWVPPSSVDYLGVAAFVVAVVALMPALLGVHLQQHQESGRLGRWGFRAAFLGAAAAGIGRLLEAFGPFPGEGVIMLVGYAIYLPGITLLGVGLVLLGVATFRARGLPRWVGPAIALGLPALLLIEFGGLFLFGLIWVAIGAHLALSRSQTTPRRRGRSVVGAKS